MKSFLKSCLFLFFAILISPITLIFWLLSLLFDRGDLLAGFSQLLSLIPGKVGIYTRSGFYRFTLTHCSPDAVISFAVLMSQVDISIEQGVYIGPQSNIGSCRIGQDTLLGSGVHIMSGKKQHNFSDLDTPIRDQGGIFTKVSVGKNCWLGNCALVMADIGDNCVVAAGSVVTNSVPDNSIVAGNPAKVIKTR